jgi:hypothetical protein
MADAASMRGVLVTTAEDAFLAVQSVTDRSDTGSSGGSAGGDAPAGAAAASGAANPAFDASEASPGAASPAAPAPAYERAVARPRRGGRWFSALCAVLSLAGAGVALTAPTLRPQAFELARAWLGDDNPLLRYLASPAADIAPSALAPLTYPPPAFQAPQSPGGETSLPAAALAAVRAELIATLRLELDGVRRAAAEQSDRVKAMGASVQATQADLASARNDARTAAGAVDSVARAQEGAARALAAMHDRLDRVEAQVAVFDERVRATGLVVVAGQLRRDIDAGAPLRDDLTAIASSGSLPVQVQQAVDQLSRAERGVPTLRDLGVGFEALDTALVARGAGQGSWFSLSAWLGGAGGPRESLDRLRALAAEGRFSEVADALERSDWADLAQRWDAQVRLHAASVIAGQAVLAHALAAYEASQTTPPAWSVSPSPAGPGRGAP